MRKLLILYLLGQVFSSAGAQQPPLDWATFRQQVLANHPLARQADLQTALAAAQLQRARGGFDPKLYADFSAKNFSEKTYYQYGEAGIKWPTWAGLEFKGAYNTARGIYLNPERTLPAGGQALLGLDWALGQGLLFDERRAGLAQSQIGLEMGAATRAVALNDLLLDAAKAYWSWVVADNQLQIYALALVQARERHAGLGESVRQGDKPAIDTIETLLQIQSRQLDQNFAALDLQNTALVLCNYLWQADQQPTSPRMLPPAPFLEGASADWLPAGDTSQILELARQQHPELRQYAAKMRSLEVERRLKQEKRKPELTVNYNLLGKEWVFSPTPTTDVPGLLTNDIKWGVYFNYPILNRKARGDWQITTVKLAQMDQDLRQKKQEIETKVRQYTNEIANFGQQLPLFQEFTANYRLLLDAEMEKFRQGESSVFLINTREQRWLDARIKYLKLLGEYHKTAAGLQWSAGRLTEF